jgi:hypothetical protein
MFQDCAATLSLSGNHLPAALISIKSRVQSYSGSGYTVSMLDNLFKMVTTGFLEKCLVASPFLKRFTSPLWYSYDGLFGQAISINAYHSDPNEKCPA